MNIEVYYTAGTHITVPVTTVWTRQSLRNSDLWANNPIGGKLGIIQFLLTVTTTADLYLDDIQLEVRLFCDRKTPGLISI